LNILCKSSAELASALLVHLMIIGIIGDVLLLAKKGLETNCKWVKLGLTLYVT
jgi:hypothetical protein